MTKDKTDIVLSASQINKYIEEPVLWALQHFLGIRGKSNIYAVRGSIIEWMLDEYLLNGHIRPYSEFRLHCCGKCLFIDVELSEELIQGLYNWSLKTIKSFENHDYGNLVSNQKKVDLVVEGIDVIGYIDYEFDGVIVDLKTTNKLPAVMQRGQRQGQLSTQKAGHIRQQLLYSKFINKPACLYYINGEGDTLPYDIDIRDWDEQWPIIESTIKEIKNLLTYEKIDDIVDIIEPKNTRSIFWDDNTRQVASKYWSI